MTSYRLPQLAPRLWAGVMVVGAVAAVGSGAVAVVGDSSLARRSALGAILLVVGAARMLALSLRRSSRFMGRAQIRRWAGRVIGWSDRQWMGDGPSGPVAIGVLVVMMLLALGLRLVFIDLPMRFDESTAFMRYNHLDWGALFSTYLGPEHHVLHTALVKASTLIFGPEPWAIRLPALAAGVALVPLTYAATKAWFRSAEAALVAAALVAGSSILVEFSVNARGYSVKTLLFVTLLLITAHMRFRLGPSNVAAVVAVSVLGLWVIPTFVYAIGVAGALFVASGLLDEPRLETREMIRAGGVVALGTGLGVALAYAPIALGTGVASITANPFVAPVPVSELPSGLGRSAAIVLGMWRRDMPALLLVTIAAGLAIAWFWPRSVGRSRIPILTMGILVIVPLLAVQRVVPFERVWLFILPAVFAMAAGGLMVPITNISGAARTIIGPVIALSAALVLATSVLLTGSVESSQQTGAFPDGRQVAEFLDGEFVNGDGIVAGASWAPIVYWLTRLGWNDPPVASLLNDFRLKDPERLLVVVNEVFPFDVSATWDLIDEDERRFGEPMLVAEFEQAAVYELRRLAAG